VTVNDSWKIREKGQTQINGRWTKVMKETWERAMRKRNVFLTGKGGSRRGSTAIYSNLPWSGIDITSK